MKNLTIALIVQFAFTIQTYAQIPNSGFENWTQTGIGNRPNSWGTFNYLTAPTNTFTCEQGTPGYAGTYYLMLTSKTITGKGIIPGRTVSGKLDTISWLPLSGFPFNQRPAYLTGVVQFMPFGSGHVGYIEILLTRWDTSMVMTMPVALTHYNLSGMQMSWDSISIPISYIEGNYPDSCTITLSASDNVPADGDYLYIDNLAFSGSVPAGIVENAIHSNFSLYPDPASNVVHLNINKADNEDMEINIYNMQGNLAKSYQLTQNQRQINTSMLENGIYIIEIKTAMWSEKQKLIIVK